MAYDIGPRIGIDGEREYREQIKNINQQMKTLDSQLQLTASEFTKETTAQEKADAKTKTLTKQIELQEQKLREQTEMLEKSREKTGETSTQTQKYQEIVNKTQTELNRMKAELQQASTQTKTLGDRMKEAGEKIQNVGSKMKGVGDNMTKYVSAPLTAIGVAGVKAFNDLDDAQDIVIKKTGATGEAAKDLKKQFKDVAGSVEAANSSFEDVGKAIGEVATRFDVAGSEANAISRDFLKFSQINKTDVETSVQLVSRAMGDAGIETKDYKKLLDSLTRATQKSGISINKLTENITKYGAPMRALGYTTNESIAIFSAWEKAGVNTEIAFSGMKKAIGQFTKEGKDAKKEFKGFIKGVQDGSISAQEALTLFGTKAGPDLVDAIQEGRFEFEDMLSLIEGAEGTLDSTFDGIIDDGDKAQAAINNLKIKLGEMGEQILTKAAPMVEKLLDGISGLLDAFNNLPEGVQNAIMAIAGIGIVGGPALSGIGRLTEGIGGIITKLGAGGGGLIATLKTAITSPFGLVALGVAGAAAFYGIMDAISEVTTEEGKHRAEVKKLIGEIDSMSNEYNKLAEARKDSLEKTNAEFDYYDRIARELDELVDANGRVKEGYESRAEFITGKLSEVYGVEVKIVDGTIEKYDELKKSIEDASNARRAEALLQGQEEAYQNAVKNIDSARKHIEDMENEIASLEDKWAAAKVKADKTKTNSDRAYVTQLRLQIDNMKNVLKGAENTYQGYANSIAVYESTSAAVREGNYKDAIRIANSLTDIENNQIRSRAEQRAADLKDEKANLAALEELYARTKDKTTKAALDASKKRISALEAEGRTTSEIVSDMEREFSKASTGATAAGENVANGFIKGMSKKAQAIAAQSASMASQAIKAFQNTYQIRSPSKVMEKMAAYAYAGWEIGSERALPKLTSQSADMAQDINRAFAGSFGVARAARPVDGVGAMKQALQGVKIVLDDEVAGRFVERTVTDIVYS